MLLFLLLLPCPGSAECTVTPSDVWRNTIWHSGDPFKNPEDQNEAGWVKFIILKCDPGKVYFQDSRLYPLHWDFARERLDVFSGYSRTEFDNATLNAEGQEAVLGAVLSPPSLYGSHSVPEYGIQLIRRDPYQLQEVIDLFNLVKSAVIAEDGIVAYYFPTYQQKQSAEENSDALAAAGIQISSLARWIKGNSCYSSGWAMGELKYVVGDQVEDSYRQGILGPEDILLTDGVPAEAPSLAGIITLSPTAGSSHVAILARTTGMPFVHAAVAGDAARAQELVGRTVLLRCYRDDEGQCNLWLDDVDGVLTSQQIAQIQAMKQPQPLAISGIERYGEYSASTDDLLVSDIRYFGGKAANFGVLRRAIPRDAPVALAFSFDLWTEYLEQIMSSGFTLRQEIDQRLTRHTYPPDFNAVADDLEEIRALFKDPGMTSFTEDQQDAILLALQDQQYQFDESRRIRFRSSTNVEDSELFTGAGLYDSFSGCLADELDEDDLGPSLCDSTRAEERGVFRAIRKVFASFYNENAFLERLRYALAEDQVGMALLVHHSFPDETELANGVAMVEWQSDGVNTMAMTLTTQLGAVSVANQTGGSISEEVSYERQANGDTRIWVTQQSNLILLGETVMNWQGDYIFLANRIAAICEQYGLETSKHTSFTLDLEYKKIGGGIVVKQVREIPNPSQTPSITPFLVGAPTELCPYQEETYDAELVFAQYRLKWRGSIETESFRLDSASPGQGFFASLQANYVGSCEVATLSGRFEDLPEPWGEGFEINSYGGGATVGFTITDDFERREYQLDVSGIPIRVSPAESPVVTLRDADEIILTVDYEHLKPSHTSPGIGGMTRTDSIKLVPCRPVTLMDAYTTTQWSSDQPEVSFTTSFYWEPTIPGLPMGGYTPPLVRYDQTVIEGLTSEPILLRSDFAQTYLPIAGHNMDSFLFDPWLDTGVPLTQLKELDDQGIRLIHFGFHSAAFYQDDTGCNKLFSPLPRQPDGRY